MHSKQAGGMPSVRSVSVAQSTQNAGHVKQTPSTSIKPSWQVEQDPSRLSEQSRQFVSKQRKQFVPSRVAENPLTQDKQLAVFVFSQVLHGYWQATQELSSANLKGSSQDEHPVDPLPEQVRQV